MIIKELDRGKVIESLNRILAAAEQTMSVPLVILTNVARVDGRSWRVVFRQRGNAFTIMDVFPLPMSFTYEGRDF